MPHFLGKHILRRQWASVLKSIDRLPIILMVGGGVTTPVIKEYIGADFQTVDAMEGVAYCMKSIGGK